MTSSAIKPFVLSRLKHEQRNSPTFVETGLRLHGKGTKAGDKSVDNGPPALDKKKTFTKSSDVEGNPFT